VHYGIKKKKEEESKLNKVRFGAFVYGENLFFSAES